MTCVPPRFIILGTDYGPRGGESMDTAAGWRDSRTRYRAKPVNTKADMNPVPIRNNERSPANPWTTNSRPPDPAAATESRPR
jgi:hypothetical protein